MARYLSLKAHYKRLRRKYKKVTPFRYFYNKKSDLSKTRRFEEIICWFLIHDEDRGYSIFNFKFRRAQSLTIMEWRDRFTKRVNNLTPIMEIFLQSVLPAINNKSGSAWKFKTLIGWSGYALPDVKGSTTSKRGNKSSKAKRARKSNPHRR